jgi:hypothetical protein
MSGLDFSIDPSVLIALKKTPTRQLATEMSGHSCSLNIIIPDHPQELNKFYEGTSFSDINSAQVKSCIDYDIHHFGLLVSFDKPTELTVHNSEMELIPIIKDLIKTYGALIVKNVFLSKKMRDIGHRNRFPHLKFHYDRTELQQTVYSLYTRNPFDEEQKMPRIASTLFTPNLVAYLQSLKEKNTSKIQKKGVASNYDLFANENMEEVISHIVAEHRWDEPEGVGELSIIDNRTVLHASYFRDGTHAGYRIGVRYCS